jgi:hypothetical protein
LSLKSKPFVSDGANLNAFDCAPLIVDAAADFAESDGDFIAPMDDLAFLLASCPDTFFGYMHSHPRELDNWLAVVRDSIFWGEPGDEAILKAYKKELITSLKQKSTEFRPEKFRILDSLQSATVRVTK